MPHLLVLIGDDSLFVSDDLVAFLLLRKQVLMLLLNKRIIFLLAGLDLTVADDLVSGVLFLDGLDLPLLHVVKHYHFFLLEVDSHFGDLFLGGEQLASFPLLTHLEHSHFIDVIVFVVVNLGGVHAFRFVLDECNTTIDDLIIPILIDLGCLLANFLNALDEAIAITVGIVSDDAHATVNFDQLLPVRHLARTIKLHSFEFVGVAVSPLQFITPVLVKVSDLLYQQLLVVLNHKEST